MLIFEAGNMMGIGVVPSTVAGAVLSQPTMGQTVEDAAAQFMLASPEALAFARKALPENGLLKRAAGFGTLGDLMAVPRGIPESPSLLARVASGVASTTIALSPAVASFFLVQRITGSSNVAICAAVGATLGAGAAALGKAAIVTTEAAVEISVGVVTAASVAGAIVGGGSIASATLDAVVATLAGSAAGAGAVVLYPWLVRFSNFLSFLPRAGRKGRETKAISGWLQDSAEVERFFAEHPDRYLDFLRGTVSETFRTGEGKARIRIDALRAKMAEARGMGEQSLRKIELADIPETAKEALKARIRESTGEALSALETTIQEEEVFIARLDAFVAEVSRMAEALQREVATANVYAEAEKHAIRMEALTGAAIEAEDARMKTLVGLAEYWRRLREMGDEMVDLQLARAEVSLALLEGNP